MDATDRVYRDQALYTDGYKSGYAQAIGDADAALRKRGDDLSTRRSRRDVLALANVPYRPDEIMPEPDWSKYSVSGPPPLSSMHRDMCRVNGELVTALQKIADLSDSEDGEPLHDAIRIARNALAPSGTQEKER